MLNIKRLAKLPKAALVLGFAYIVFCYFFVMRFYMFVTNSKFASTAEDLGACKLVELTEENPRTVDFKLEPRNGKWHGITVFYDVLDGEKPHAVALTVADEGGNIVFGHKPGWETFSAGRNYCRFTFVNTINAKSGAYTVSVSGTNVALKCGESGEPAYKLYGNILKKFLAPALAAFWLALLACGALVFFLVYGKKLKVETLFLLGASAFGLFFMLAMPPLAVGDECRHYDTAYALSNRLLGIKETQGYTVTKRACDAVLVPDDYMENENWTKADYYKTIWPHALKATKNKDTSLVAMPPYASTQNAYLFSYLPAALGLTLGRLLKLNCIFTFLLGRFFNLLLFVLVGYFAMRKYACGKTFFASFALLPMFLHQIASYSYDSVLMTLAFYFVFAVSSLIAERRKLSLAEMLCLCAAAFVVAPAKAVYFPLLFLVLLLSKEQFAGNKSRIIFCGAVLAMIVLGFATNRLYSRATAITVNHSHEAAAARQTAGIATPVPEINTARNMKTIGWMFAHPFQFLYMVLFSFAERGSYYLETAAGRFLGWESIPMNELLVGCIVALVVFQLLQKSEGGAPFALQARPLWHRIFASAVFVFITFSIFASFFISNEIDFIKPVIGAIQGRYFLPILPLLYLARGETAEPEVGTAQGVFCAEFLILVCFAVDLLYRIVGIF